MSVTSIVKKDFRHSFSSVGKFVSNPSAWLCHYGLGLRSPTTPAMVRGNVSEFGAYYKLKEQVRLKVMNYVLSCLNGNLIEINLLMAKVSYKTQ